MLEWHAPIGAIEALPLVVRMRDVDGDGRIGTGDPPDVVAVPYVDNEGTSFLLTPFTTGRLVVLAGDDGREIGRAPDSVLVPWASPATADVDGDGHPEVFALVATSQQCVYSTLCHSDADCRMAGTVVDYRCVIQEVGDPGGLCCTPGPAVALDHPEGVRLAAFTWDPATSNPVGRRLWTSTEDLRLSQSSVAVVDLDGDGTAEVQVNNLAFNARTGERLWRAAAFVPGRNRASEGTHSQRYGDLPVLVDLDGDGRTEGYRSDSSVDHLGALRWTSTVVPRGHAISGDFLSAHVGAELFVINGYRAAILDPTTGLALAGPFVHADDGEEAIDMLQAGAPVVADIDGDGDVEAASFTQTRIAVFDFDDSPSAPVVWEYPLMTDFGSSPMAVFDFDADGQVEIVVLHDGGFSILGIDRDSPGLLKDLWDENFQVNTAWQYPIIADVDGDANAEVVIPARSGIRVYGDSRDNWVNTRALWNQHAYYINNVADDATVPRHAPSNVSTHGTFRLQSLPDPDAITLAPDLVVAALSAQTWTCPSESVLNVRVQNIGARGVPAGVSVAVFAGTPSARGARLGSALTTIPLLSGQATWVDVVLRDPGFAPEIHRVDVHAVVNHNDGTLPINHECNDANNVSSAFTLVCPELI